MKKLLKKTLVILLTVILTLSSFILSPVTSFAEDSDGYIPSNQISSTFEYYVGDSTFFYDDAYFNNPASVYNPSFATTSLCVAMSAFNNPSKGYTDGARCAEDIMKKMGFRNISANGYYAEKPSSDSMGAVIGSKEISLSNGKIQPVIIMALRGGNYESEWAGNVTIGTSGEHQGFSDARDIATIWLNKYIRETVGKFSQSNYEAPKIWIVGYSRASATANLTGCFVNCAISGEGTINNTYLELKENLQRLGVGTEDVYVYCFEVPQGLTIDAKYNPTDQSNIWCLANPADPVPYVAPASMGFLRAGTTIDPTDRITYDEFMFQMNQINPKMAKEWDASEFQNAYKTRSSNIFNLLGNIISNKDFNYAETSEVGDNPGEFIDSLVNELLVPGMKNLSALIWNAKGKTARQIYNDYYQKPIQILAKAFMGATSDDRTAFTSALGKAFDDNFDVWTKIDLAMGFRDFAWGGSAGHEIANKVAVLLGDVFADLSKDERVKKIISPSDMETLKESSYNLGALVASLYLEDQSCGYQHIATAKSYASELFLPHYPEYVLAYMRAGDPNYYEKELEQYQLVIRSADGKPLEDIQLNVYVEDLKSPYGKDLIASLDKNGLNTSYEFSSGWWSGSASYTEEEMTLFLNRDKNNTLVKTTDYRFEIINKSEDGSRQNLKLDYNILKEGKDNNKKTDEFEKAAIPISKGDVLRIIPNTADRSYATFEKYIELTPVFLDEKQNEISGGNIVARRTSDNTKADFAHFLLTEEHKYEITAPEGKFLKELAIPVYDESGNIVMDPERDVAYTRYVTNPSVWDWNECSMPLYIFCSDRYTDGKAYADITYQYPSATKKLIDEIDTTIPLKLANRTKGAEDIGKGQQYIDAEAGDLVEVSFDKSKLPAGKVFNGWSLKTSVDVERNEDGTKLTFIMPEGGAEVHAMIGDKVDGVTLTFTGIWAHPNGKLPEEVDGYWRQVYIDPEYTSVSFKNAVNYYPVKHIYRKMDKDRNGKAWILAPGYSSEASKDMVFDHWEVYYTDSGEKCTDRIAVETYFDSATDSYATQMANPNSVKNELLVLENIKKSLTVIPVYVPAEYEVHIRYSTRSQKTLRFKAGETVTITDSRMVGYDHDKWAGYYNPLLETVDRYGNVTRSFDKENKVDMGEIGNTDGELTFTMPKGDVYVTATNKLAEYEVSWISDGIKTADGKTTYHWNDVVTIVPDKIPHSCHLTDVWVASGLENPEDVDLVKNEEGNVVSLTFKMEDKDVELEYSSELYPESTLTLQNAEASYVDNYEIIKLPDHQYTVYENDVIDLKAVVPEGYYFKEWKVTEGGAELIEQGPEEAYFVMPGKDLTIEAVLGVYEEIDDVELDFTSAFAGNQLTPESAYVTNGNSKVKEESVEVEQIAEVWRLDPMIFGYTYKFAFTLEPEEGYFFGENTVVKLHGKECSVIASADGTAAIECEITTDPAHVTEIKDMKGLTGLPAYTSLEDIQAKMPKVANAYVTERHSWITPVICWDWEHLEDEEGNPFLYDETSGKAQEFYVTATSLDFSNFVGEFQEYETGGLVIGPEVSYNHRAKVTVLEENKVALPYVSSEKQPGSYSENIDVELSCDTEGAKIYYLLDEPEMAYTKEEILEKGTEYGSAISLIGKEGKTVNQTIYTIAVDTEEENTKVSEPAVFDYTIAIPMVVSYHLSVVNGIGSGDYPADGKTLIGIKANKAAKNAEYIGFSVKTGSVEPVAGGLNKNYCNFYMPESDVELVANYKIKALNYMVANPAGGKKFSFEVGSSYDNPKEAELIKRGDGYITYYDRNGTECSGVAGYNKAYTGVISVSIPEGYTFADDIKVSINGKNAKVSMKEDGTLQAETEFSTTCCRMYCLKVIHGIACSIKGKPAKKMLLTASPSDAAQTEILPVFDGVSELYSGELIQVTAEEIEGKVFAGWEGNVEIQSMEGNTAQFIMPEQDITLTALYKDLVDTVELKISKPTNPDWILARKALVTSEGIADSSAQTKWNKNNRPVTSVDEEGRYLVSIEVTAADGYVLNENAKATINGSPCEITVLDNGERAVLSTSFEVDDYTTPDDPVSPDTGDHSNVKLYVIILLICLVLGIVAFIFAKRRKK